MAKATKKNFTEGPLFWRLTLFAIPIMLTGFLQIAYNMADNIIVGKFSGDALALAAVGSSGTLNTLIVNLLMGIGSGAGVAIAQWYGANDHKRVSEGVHTALLAAVIGGAAVSGIGILISEPALRLLGTKPEVLAGACLYIRIICLGIPGSAVYNFGAAILRATGNSKTPLGILAASGLLNVIFNVIFVTAFNMSVDGVALATIISQYASAIAVLTVLAFKKNEPYGLKFSALRISTVALARMMRLGIPMGLQGMVYSIANLVMVAAINTFPTAAITANTIAGNIDAITWTVINSFGQATTTLVGQNCGAKKPERVKRVVSYALIQTAVTVIVIASTELLLADVLINLYLDSANADNAAVIAYAKEIMFVMLTSYVIFGVVDSTQSTMRGLGHSLEPTIITLVCICGLRITWILGIAPMIKTVWGLYLAFPLSWILGGSVSVLMLIRIFGKFKKEVAAKRTLEEEMTVPV